MGGITGIVVELSVTFDVPYYASSTAASDPVVSVRATKSPVAVQIDTGKSLTGLALFVL